ncbi:SH3 domain-containing protein [Sphingomonas sp. MMS24-J13]|uniref:SH3 domain-containing protein n=1 Tax=Sphingomonas sp. MMS24-J13 TaxID=3238686 RepID=UPI0038513D16
MKRITILLAMLTAAPASAQVRTVPYWASIAAAEAMMRTGPDRSYPAIWVYKRRDLPLRVLQIEGAWRRVQEQDGTSGWMLASLLSAKRAAVVTGTYRPIREARDDGSRLLWQAAPGVVGRISQCDGQWCRIAIGARTGYIPQSGLWGTDPGEQLR